MRALITVGTTKFDALISAVFASHSLILSALKAKGYSTLVVQCGNSSFNKELQESVVDGRARTFRSDEGVEIELWKYKPSLEEEFERADLVIGHAGAGTILDVLRKGKLMIVVPNPTLLDNHQQELADALEELGYLKAATVETLPEAIAHLDPSAVKPFPPFDGSRFAKIMDETMGFI